ncbi:hypothetical protein IJF81_06630 [bacterium]|nr:hypothetical protein [bacterium]
MARIIEGKRRMIKLSVDDIISIVSQYQYLTKDVTDSYDLVRLCLEHSNIYIPEDL